MEAIRLFHKSIVRKICKSKYIMKVLKFSLYRGEKMNYIDLFAGAGGMSEGFIREGFNPIAHVEVDKAACNTLKTRTAYHYLKNNNRVEEYYKYLKGEINRNELYSMTPKTETDRIINKEINTENIKEIIKKIDYLKDGKNIDLIIGGPPCQAYSVVGRSRDENGMKGDERNDLYNFYADFLKTYKPKFFVFENVLGLLSANNENGEKYIDLMIKLYENIGYKVEYKVLCSSDFGVLQKRKRVILIGRKGTKKDFYPKFKKVRLGGKVKDVLDDLPKLMAGEGVYRACKLKKTTTNYLGESGIRNEDVPVTFHIARGNQKRDLDIYKIAVKKWSEKGERLVYNDLPSVLKTHKNTTSFSDRFKVVAGEREFSHTVVAHIAKDGHHYIHPDIKQNRSLTPREAARLQSFPDDYYFESVKDILGRTAAYRQIGNAVPVLMAQVIAKELRGLFYG